MTKQEYHQRIIDYYRQTENAYKDSWDLNRSLAIHYGYWDKQVHSFPQSLQRMNEVMMESAGIREGDRVLDAGCGVGGSSVFLASVLNCRVTGITLSDRQVTQAKENATQRGVTEKADFQVMDYAQTDFPDQTFDIVWGCESICYAHDKDKFIQEAFRVLKPGGRLVVADGFVSTFNNNDLPTIRQWLDGWEVNYLESPDRFTSFLNTAGFTAIQYRDISREASRSSRRLYRFYFLASAYLIWKKINFSGPPTDMQKRNIKACLHQYKGMKKGLWQYGLFTAQKPG